MFNAHSNSTVELRVFLLSCVQDCWGHREVTGQHDAGRLITFPVVYQFLLRTVGSTVLLLLRIPAAVLDKRPRSRI